MAINGWTFKAADIVLNKASSWEDGLGYPEGTDALSCSSQNDTSTLNGKSEQDLTSQPQPSVPSAESESLRTVKPILPTGPTQYIEPTNPEFSYAANRHFDDFFVRACCQIYGMRRDNVSRMEAEYIIDQAFASDFAAKPWCKKTAIAFFNSAFGARKKIASDLHPMVDSMLETLNGYKNQGLTTKDAIKNTLAVYAEWRRVYGEQVYDMIARLAEYSYGSRMYSGVVHTGDKLTVYAGDRYMCLVTAAYNPQRLRVTWANNTPQRLTVKPYEVIVQYGCTAPNCSIFSGATTDLIITAEANIISITDQGDIKQRKADDTAGSNLKPGDKLKTPDGKEETVAKTGD